MKEETKQLILDGLYEAMSNVTFKKNTMTLEEIFLTLSEVFSPDELAYFKQLAQHLPSSGCQSCIDVIYMLLSTIVKMKTTSSEVSETEVSDYSSEVGGH
jgi:hypothetical protein